MNHYLSLRPASRRPLDGFSLIEAMVAVTIIGILAAVSIPSYRRAIEQSKADIAAANLRAVWSAQRFYWLEYQCFAADLAQLQSLGLIDPAVVLSNTGYEYSMRSSGSDNFRATATRTNSADFSGHFDIDETGLISGAICSPGTSDITPGYQ